MKRRRLLVLGSAGLLAAAGGGLMMMEPAWRGGQLQPGGREVLRAVARAVLAGVLPADPAAAGSALDAHVARLDIAIAAFPSAVQAELAQLLSLLASAPGRWVFAGLRTPWPQATESELATMLAGLRHSTIELRQQTYHALRDLTNAAYFSDASTWTLMSYPGPQPLN